MACNQWFVCADDIAFVPNKVIVVKNYKLDLNVAKTYYMLKVEFLDEINRLNGRRSKWQKKLRILSNIVNAFSLA